jgi:hypothetical protein
MQRVLLGSCIWPIAVRELFLEAKTAAEEALLAQLVEYNRAE